MQSRQHNFCSPTTGLPFTSCHLVADCTITMDRQCSRCLAPTYSDDGLTCKQCNGEGQYSDVSGASSCKSSPAGFVPNTGHTGIVACPTGKYSIGGKTSCTACPIGKYSDTPGSAGCKACELGSVTGYVANIGTTSCLPCPPPSYSNDGEHCQNCDGDGQFSDKTGAFSCRTAKAGHKPTEDRKGEEQCPAGKYSTGGADECLQCGEGETSIAGAAGCSTCATCATGRYMITACTPTSETLCGD